MRINKNGNLYRLLDVFGEPPTNSCTFIPKVAMASLFAFVILPIFVAGLIILIFNIWASLFINGFFIDEPVVVVGGIILHILIIIYIIDRYRDKFYYAREEKRKYKKLHPSVLRQLYNNFKDKICTKVEYYEK